MGFWQNWQTDFAIVLKFQYAYNWGTLFSYPYIIEERIMNFLVMGKSHLLKGFE
jgi:hypothetical protein